MGHSICCEHQTTDPAHDIQAESKTAVSISMKLHGDFISFTEDHEDEKDEKKDDLKEGKAVEG